MNRCAKENAARRLVYENAHWTLAEYDGNGEGGTTDESWEESGYFYLSGTGELCRHDELAGGEDSAFVRAA